MRSSSASQGRRLLVPSAVLLLLLLLLSDALAATAQTAAASTGSTPGTAGLASIDPATYSFGWAGISLPTTGESSLTFEQYWVNEAMMTSLNAGNSLWIENATGSQTSCTVPWMESGIALLSLAQTYRMTVAIQLPSALTDYGGNSYASLATDGYTNGLTTYNMTGQVAEGYVRVDTPLLSQQIYNDLLAMYHCFGQYTSWIGISQSSNAADHGGYDWAGTTGPGEHSLGNQTIHDWLEDSEFYSPAGNDSLTYNMATKEPKVSTLSVFRNIQAYHEGQFNNFLTWNDYNQVQLALNMFYKHTGKKLLYIDYDHEGVDRIYSFPPTQVPVLFKNITSVVLSGSQPCRPTSDSCISSIMGNVDPSTGVDTTFMFSPGQCTVSGKDPTKQLLSNYMYLYPYMGAMSTGFQVDSTSTSCSGLENSKSNEFSVFNEAGTILDRMKDVGSFFGTENPGAPRVLLVYQQTGQDSNLGGEVAQMLGSMDVNVTVTSDMNLTGIQLSDYSTILYRPYTGFPDGGAVLTPYAANAVKEFVQDGGGFVAIPETLNGYWNSTYWNTYFATLFGVKASSVSGFVSGGTISVPKPSSEILMPYGSAVTAGGYEPGLSGGTSTETLKYASTSPSVTTIIKSSNLGPEVWTNTYGSGRVVMLPGGQQLSSDYGYASYDAYWTLVSNAIMYASKDDSLVPVLSYPSFYGGAQHEPWDQSTMYSILGTPGEGALAWFYTNKTGGDSISVQLNANAYHISTSGWIAIDAYDWEVVGQGTGGTIDLNVKIPATGWYPVYILSKGSNGALLYSNSKLVTTKTSPASDAYELSSAPGSSSWLVVQLSSAPASVTSADTGVVPEMGTLASLATTTIGEHLTGSAWKLLTQTGWYYDSANDLLYVHYEGGSQIMVTVAA